MTPITVPFQRPIDKGSRGRNRWFAASSATVGMTEQGIRLEVVSRRPGDVAPIVVELSPEDAGALATALQEAANAHP